MALTMSGLSSLTLKTGKTWTGDLKTIGSDDQSPEAERKNVRFWFLVILGQILPFFAPFVQFLTKKLYEQGA